ncbi:hypothetical protein ACTOS9_21755 (plasmid) [Bacillus subtilis]|uniref:Uncharacterized protein n=1 Tax=Bacillus subtilis TaxID=1423 RepID=A0A8I1WHY4_BACIU|nr:hypothetical protein [Bacillus subtilis]MBO3796476.1 hypothetical protein [Bacillus subtilis]MCM3191313.1 hypothetical protein [Bacillus subtilis]WEY82930.1 hypothetical protein P5633_00270 [Bacillus subtilis]WGD64163.1 hypothetical protein P5648_22395 [Bacillus subtilis]WGD72646.1 hypothetical protein P5645_21920 [Bacillus subtilis]
MQKNLKDLLTWENINGEKLDESDYAFIADLERSYANAGDYEMSYHLLLFRSIQQINQNGGYPVAKKILSLIDEEPVGSHLVLV